MEPVWAIGLMTGTVLDGMIDIAMIRTDGVEVSEFGPWKLAPYPVDIRGLLGDAVQAALDWKFEGPEPAIFREAEIALSQAQATAIGEFLNENAFSASDITVIGFHGQTVLHRAPEGGRHGDTRQLGDGKIMADHLGIDVAYDFRTQDMHAGGHGAPLSGIYHQALLRKIAAPTTTAALNLGGVANITWWDGKSDFHAFDTGPANGPLNDWISRHDLGDMDVDGEIARKGTVDEAKLASLLTHPFLSAPYPKSLDRYDYTADMANGSNIEDGAALLTAFTAGTVGMSLDLLPVRPTELIICGGGRKNPMIVDAIRERAKVTPLMAEDVGWRGDAVEAECFAYLAVRVLRGLPISFPMSTGVEEPITGGRVARHGA